MSYSNNQDSNDKSKRYLPWLIGAIVALAGTNIYTIATSSKKTDTITQQTTALQEKDDLNLKLDNEFKQASAELEAMKTNNAELNGMIDQQKAELQKQKDKINKLINVDKNYAAAKAEIARLKAQTQGYLDQIARLEQEKKEMGTQITVLTSEKSNLEENLVKERTAKDELATQKTAVESEKARIERERNTYAKKTEIGAVVRVSNLQTLGMKVTGSGKTRERSHADNVDRLQWCFDALENRVTEGGRETFYLRLIDPSGVAIATTAGGGGVLKLADGKDVQYTTSKAVDFNGDMQNACVIWDTKGNAELKKGEYIIEIYNKGYLAGKGNFKLK